jgi:aminoglycoside phosphotransferase (APT) family kinase protein
MDDHRDNFERGVLIMEYLPGEPLDYLRDCEAAAALFTCVHKVPVDEGDNHLIRESAPLSLIYDECDGLLRHYFESDLADPNIREYLMEVKQWADAARAAERYYQQDPWHCIINTEVNSGNFIVNRRRSTIHLVDWEMPRWGDPSQDLCHFCSPLTTLWKTRFRMTPFTKREFFDLYKQQIDDQHLRNTLVDRVRLRDPFVLLRGISWSAMGWVAYQTDFAGVKNADTWQTLQRYMQLDFIRGLFDPILNRG